jgi:hypothetical protein
MFRQAISLMIIQRCSSRSHFPGNVRFYTSGCKFIDHILNSGIMKFDKPFAAWLVAELLFAELRPEPSFLT